MALKTNKMYVNLISGFILIMNDKRSRFLNLHVVSTKIPIQLS